MDPLISSHLRFPPEVWSITLGNLRQRRGQDELIYLWTTVRHVCRQFKEEVEEIFHTEHLPKSWLFIDTYYNRSKRTLASLPTPQAGRYNEKIVLHFDGFKPKHPDKAIFSFRQVPSSQYSTRYAARVLGSLRDDLWAEEPTERIPSQRKGQIPTIKKCTGRFVVKIKGGLNDSAVSGLHLDPKKHQLSLDWKALIGDFFRDKHLTREVVRSSNKLVPIDNKQTNVEQTIYQGNEPDNLLRRVKSSLRPSAAEDRSSWKSLFRSSQKSFRQFRCLHKPLSTWTGIVAGQSSKSRSSLENCRLRLQADQDIDLDEEGAVNEARLSWEIEGQQVEISDRAFEWARVTKACDSCRECNIECKKSDQHDCNACVSSGIPCKYSLAVLNGHNNPPSDHVIVILSAAYDIQVQLNQSLFLQTPQGGNHVLQNYQAQLMQLEQQNIQRKVGSLELTGAWLQIRDDNAAADVSGGQTWSSWIQRGATQRKGQKISHRLGSWPPTLRAVSSEAGIPVAWRILSGD